MLVGTAHSRSEVGPWDRRFLIGGEHCSRAEGSAFYFTQQTAQAKGDSIHGRFRDIERCEREAPGDQRGKMHVSDSNLGCLSAVCGRIRTHDAMVTSVSSLTMAWDAHAPHAHAPAAPAAFFVLRSSGHVGSRWLGELIATQNLSFLFEFGGRCPQARYPAMANQSMHDIFASACACRLDAAMAPAACTDDEGRIRSMSCVKSAYCSGTCPRRSGRGCLGVGMVDGYQHALAQRLAAARGVVPIAVATFERDNAAKHALSKLRASCSGTALKGNHVKALPNASAAARSLGASVAGRSHGSRISPRPNVSLIHVDPTLFLREASASLAGRRRMREGVARTLGAPQHALHYEDLQLAPATSLRALLAAVGVSGLDERALERSLLRKGSSEDLRTSLLNFDELHASLPRCLQHMLAARTPRRFDDSCAPDSIAGGAREHGGNLPPPPPQAHRARQETSVRVLHCVGEAATCHVGRMNRVATAAVAAAARAAGARARRKRRRDGTFDAAPAAGTAPLRAKDGPLPTTAALIAGECAPEERRMCREAVAHALLRAGATSSGEAVHAELCVLRTEEQPLPLLS